MQRSISFERTLAVDYDAAIEVLRDTPERVALDDARTDTLDLHAEVGGFDVARSVTVTLGALRQLDAHAVALPLNWHATERPRRFPTFEGLLELSALSHRQAQSQLALVGTVTPPMGVLGAVGEAVGGTQLADGVLAALVDRMATRLVELVAARAARTTAADTATQLSRPRVVIDA